MFIFNSSKLLRILFNGERYYLTRKYIVFHEFQPEVSQHITVSMKTHCLRSVPTRDINNINKIVGRICIAKKQVILIYPSD